MAKRMLIDAAEIDHSIRRNRVGSIHFSSCGAHDIERNNAVGLADYLAAH